MTRVRGQRRPHDLQSKMGRQPKEPKADWLREMADKLRTDEGRQHQWPGERTVGLMVGIAKSVLGFCTVSLRASTRLKAGGT